MIDIGNPVSRDFASVINANNPTVDDSALPCVGGPVARYASSTIDDGDLMARDASSATSIDNPVAKDVASRSMPNV